MQSSKSNIQVQDEPFYKSQMPVNAVGALTNDGTGVLTWAASGGTVNVGKSIFVSVDGGDDATALPYRFDKMFQSPSLANDVAVAGDTIFFYPGLYPYSSMSLKDGVNYHLYSGARLEAPGNPIFTDDLEASVTCKITGDGVIYSTSDVVRIINESTSVTIEGITMLSNSGCIRIMPTATSSTVRLKNVKMQGFRGIEMYCGLVILDNVTIVATVYSIESETGSPQNIKVYSCRSNVTDDGNITNLIAGTTLIVDADVS